MATTTTGYDAKKIAADLANTKSTTSARTNATPTVPASGGTTQMTPSAPTVAGTSLAANSAVGGNVSSPAPVGPNAPASNIDYMGEISKLKAQGMQDTDPRVAELYRARNSKILADPLLRQQYINTLNRDAMLPTDTFRGYADSKGLKVDWTPQMGPTINGQKIDTSGMYNLNGTFMGTQADYDNVLRGFYPQQDKANQLAGNNSEMQKDGTTGAPGSGVDTGQDTVNTFITQSTENLKNLEARVGDNLSTGVQKVDGIFNQINQTIAQAGNMPDDSKALLASYMTDITSELTRAEQEARDSVKNGMNDPGLQAALTIMREEADKQRKLLIEDMNARGLNTSGLLAKVQMDLSKGMITQEQQMIGNHLSQLTSQLNQNLQSIVTQRIQGMTQFAGMDVNAQQNAMNRALQATQLKISGLTNMAQMQQNQTKMQNDTMLQMGQMQQQSLDRSAMMGMEMAKMKLDDNQFQQTFGLSKSQFEESKRQFNEKMTFDIDKLGKELGIEQSKIDIMKSELGLKERAQTEVERSNKAQEGFEGRKIGIEEQKLAEAIRSNKVSEDIRWSEIDIDKMYKEGMLSAEQARIGIQQMGQLLDASRINQEMGLQRDQYNLAERKLNAEINSADATTYNTKNSEFNTLYSNPEFQKLLNGSSSDIDKAVKQMKTLETFRGVDGKDVTVASVSAAIKLAETMKSTPTTNKPNSTGAKILDGINTTVKYIPDIINPSAAVGKYIGDWLNKN